MEYTRFGVTDITVPRLCIGGISFGEVFPDFHQWVIDQEATQAVIARALELGVSFIDTTGVYSRGTNEEFTGASLKNLGVKCEDVVLASKTYLNEGYLSRGAIEREINGILKRLGTNYLDLHIIHRFDYTTPIEETLEVLDALVCSGRVRALGVLSTYAYQLHAMQVTADAHGWTRFFSIQNHYNLFYRGGGREMIPMCYQYNMSLTPYSSLAPGHLTRPTQDLDSVRPTDSVTTRGKYDRGHKTNMPIIERVAELARRHQVAMADVALVWLWVRGVAAPIVGCSRPSHVDDAVRALELTLTGEGVAFLKEPYVPHEPVGPLVRSEDVPQR